MASDDAGPVSPDGLYAAADLRVAGAGRLEINVDLKSAGYTGEVHVVAGAILRLTANGALGDTAHGTFVADGATLETESLDSSADNRLAFANEKLSFAGTGVGGLGALIARTPARKERNGVWGGTCLTMTGDAMISAVTGYQDFPCNSINNSLNMNGHTLTVNGFLLANGSFFGGFCLRPVVTNPGHIVILNCGASINDLADLGGGTVNTLTVGAPRSSLELYDTLTLGRKPWTLRVPADNVYAVPLFSSSHGGVWDGPVVVERDFTLTLNSQKNSDGLLYTNNSTFAGPFTVKGAMTVNNSPAKDAVDVSLTLTGEGHVFEKDISLGPHIALRFSDAATNSGLPGLTVAGANRVEGGNGDWASVVKEGGRIS